MPELNKEFLVGFLSRTGIMDEDGVASLFNEDGSLAEDAETKLDDAHAAHATRLKTPLKGQTPDDHYKRGQRETAEKLEKEFKEKTGFKSDLKGVELFLDYAKAQASKELPEEAVKSHKLYLQLEQKYDADIKAAREEGEKKVKEFQEEQKKKDFFATIAKEARSELKKLKALEDADQLKADALFERTVLTDLQGYEWEEVEGVRYAMKDGQRVEDKHGRALKFTDLVKKHAEMYYTFEAAEKRTSAENKDDGQGKKFSFVVPKNDEEYIKAFNSLDPVTKKDERIALTKAYEESQKATT